jgi:TPR repeat protein
MMLVCTCTVHAQGEDPILIYQKAVNYLEARVASDQDVYMGVALLEQLAADEWSVAQNRLGECLERGLGVTRDLDEAMAWYQRAADQGHPVARSNLLRLQKTQALAAAGPAESFSSY